MLRTSTIRALLTALVLVSALVGAAQSAAANQQDDPCRTREPTLLDKLPEWRCVGLAKFHDEKAEPPELDGAEDDEKTRRSARDDYGMAVSPDGRLYLQIAPSPARTVPDLRAFNPDGKEVETEGGKAGYRLNPFTILGSDDRQVRLSTTSYPWRVFAAIRPPGSTVSNCSGALVGPRHVLTAGHCIYNNGAWFPNRKVAPGQSGINSAPNGLKNSAWYYSVVGWTQNGDKNYDYGMIILEDRNDTAHLGWLGWWSSNHSGDVWNFGYPGWSQNCAASPAPPLCNNYLYGDDGVIQTANSHMLGYSLDMTNGQSGSPVYKYNGGDRRVIAVNAYNAGTTGKNWGTRVRSAVSQNICNWIGNWPSAYNYHGCY